jgi:hypothetical protein
MKLVINRKFKFLEIGTLGIEVDGGKLVDGVMAK